MQNVHQLKDTGYYINENFGKATLNIRAEFWDETSHLEEKVIILLLNMIEL